MLFFDTCALLEQSKLPSKFYISSTTYTELEEIKTSRWKDEDVKYKARQVVNFLKDNVDAREIIFTQERDFQQFREDEAPFLPNNNDGRILFDACQAKKQCSEDIVFVTEDGLCGEFAMLLGLDTMEADKSDRGYKGYTIIEIQDEEELGVLYTNLFTHPDLYDFVENQYILIRYKGIIQNDVYKFTKGRVEDIPYPTFYNKYFGKIKPQDPFQMCLMDSMIHNQITLAGGVAGAGKSYLSLGFLLQQLEQGKIDRIILFCNTVAVKDAARLGFYPGTKVDKLMDSQIGNFLSSKLGSDIEVERMIDEGQIILLPLADSRGYDSTGMRAGIYVQESQNLSVEHMKLILQRIGEDCICILDGDYDSQVDMVSYQGINNGLRRVSEVFKGESLYGQVNLPIIHRSKIADIASRM